MRINKYLASCGVASRRKVEDFIREGKVCIDGEIMTNLAYDVSDEDIVTVDGEPVVLVEEKIYLALHKPKGCVCTNSDEEGRKTVFDLLPKELQKYRLFCVGRLDYNTEGLIVLTNDGDMAQKLIHPSHNIKKVYIARVDGDVSQSDLNELRNGILIDGVRTSKAVVEKLNVQDGKTRIQITIFEGRNRQVRRMFEAIGHEVDFLVRKSIGQINLGGLERTAIRYLSPKEVGYLRGIE